jgi:hypothetical protein
MHLLRDEIDRHRAGRCTATEPVSMPVPIAHREAA